MDLDDSTWMKSCLNHMLQLHIRDEFAVSIRIRILEIRIAYTFAGRVIMNVCFMYAISKCATYALHSSDKIIILPKPLKVSAPAIIMVVS